MTRLFGPGEPVILQGFGSPELRVVSGYTRNRCYRLVETTHYTGCDHHATDIEPLPAEGYAYLVKIRPEDDGTYYVPGSRCVDCDTLSHDRIQRAGVPCANAFSHAKHMLKTLQRGWIEAVAIADLSVSISATLMDGA